MNEILRFMQKRDERTDGQTDVRKAFYNLPTSAFGRSREIKMFPGPLHTHAKFEENPSSSCLDYGL